MEITLKKLSIYERMSEETTAFVTDVYADGKKIGHAKNDGHGGNTSIDLLDRTRYKEYSAALADRVPAEYRSATNALEWVVDELVGAARDAKEKARMAKAVAKNDAFYKARCAKLGRACARFDIPSPFAVETRWVEYLPGDEAQAKAQATEKHTVIENWTVIA